MALGGAANRRNAARLWRNRDWLPQWSGQSLGLALAGLLSQSIGPVRAVLASSPRSPAPTDRYRLPQAM